MGSSMKNALDSATQLADDWSRLLIPLARDMDMRDSDWESKMPTKVYAAIRNLWIARRSFVEMLKIEIGDTNRRSRSRSRSRK